MGQLPRDYYSKILSSSLKIGRYYTVHDMTALLDFENLHALRKGVVSKKDQDFCLLKISLQKHKKTNPYSDRIIGNTLLWDSPIGDSPYGDIPTYQKYIERGYTFFVFIQDDIKKPYKYYGRAYPVQWQTKKKGIPAKVSFLMYDYQQDFLHIPIVDEVPASIVNPSNNGDPLPTTKTRVVKTRTVQNKFRKDTLDLWNHKCAVSSVDDDRILIASHIKPWRSSDDSERVDPHNGLILNPTYDKLFDLGFISFSPDNGRIMLSDEIESSIWDNLRISGKEALSFIPSKTESFLDYHNNVVFNMTGGIAKEELLVI